MREVVLVLLADGVTVPTEAGLVVEATVTTLTGTVGTEVETVTVTVEMTG